jgi:hypothetical protein
MVRVWDLEAGWSVQVDGEAYDEAFKTFDMDVIDEDIARMGVVNCVAFDERKIVGIRCGEGMDAAVIDAWSFDH